MLALIEFDPIVWLHIGPLRISPHGIGTAVGFLAGVWLFAPIAFMLAKHGFLERGALWWWLDIVFALLALAYAGVFLRGRWKAKRL